MLLHGFYFSILSAAGCISERSMNDPARPAILALLLLLPPPLLVPGAAVAQPEIAARTYMLVDVTANQVLAAKDIDAPVEQASLTKLMTGYLVFDALRAKKVTLEELPRERARLEDAWPAHVHRPQDAGVSVDDLLQGMIVQSGNDATVALAEGVGGTYEKLRQTMNDQAKALGMKWHQLQNPEGRPSRPRHHCARPERAGQRH